MLRVWFIVSFSFSAIANSFTFFFPASRSMISTDCLLIRSSMTDFKSLICLLSTSPILGFGDSFFGFLDFSLDIVY